MTHAVFAAMGFLDILGEHLVLNNALRESLLLLLLLHLSHIFLLAFHGELRHQQQSCFGMRLSERSAQLQMNSLDDTLHKIHPIRG